MADNQIPKKPPSYVAPEPAAYDDKGRPLYHHPAPAPSPPDAHTVVHMTRAVEPKQPEISEATKQKHELTKKQYPHLNISHGEYVISAIRRHPIGLFVIWALEGAAIVVVIVFWLLLVLSSKNSSATGALSDLTSATLGATTIALLLVAFFVMAGYIATVVYQANRFYLTNESVIQQIQTALFARHEQTVSLANIEDASFRQSGIVQHLFNYGTLRLSTEGDETTYRFSFVANPQRQVDTLNNAVEAFKNGRPVDED